MGTYLNPGNDGFAAICRGDYVDKTGLIGAINARIGGPDSLICISRPRRFGKSYAAQMLCAYYGKHCDSRDLFEHKAITEDASYERHLNKYDVIYVDMTQVMGESKESDFISFLKEKIVAELKREHGSLEIDSAFTTTLLHAVELTGNKFIMIIDEWDAPIREQPGMERHYLEFLRTLFKSSATTSRIFAAAYMTGILPIKKDGSQSAISDFKEYSMLEPLEFAGYFGFTEAEVCGLCDKYDMDFENAKYWYDGYTVGTAHSIYNPYSVMSAIKARKFKSYWKKTSAAETLMTYIDMDQDGLQADIARLIAGESVVVDTDTFQNDVQTFTCKDDVLTLLVHLGYLTYEEVSDSYGDADDVELTGLVRIPNEEVRVEFEKILRRSKHESLVELVRKSDRLLENTIAGKSEEVAKAIQEVHDSEYAPTFYNNEQSLRYVIKMAYLSSIDQYAKVEELPSGHGIADIAFVPKKSSPLPAIIVELKWNKGAEGALRQIKDRKYHKVFEQFDREIVLVGISYDEASKRHTCQIERVCNS